PLQGCLLAAAAGAGAAYVYLSSEKAEVEATPRQVVAAAERVMDRMDLSVESSASSALDGLLVARTATCERVRVSVSSKEPGISAVTVRVGLADDTAAGRILEAIRDRL
ncbi:MAG: DUF3568 family protein, partial [Planctomycetota bacterium]|nr:DUF3568 family protein [Planctomycetota bacterium]